MMCIKIEQIQTLIEESEKRQDLKLEELFLSFEEKVKQYDAENYHKMSYLIHRPSERTKELLEKDNKRISSLENRFNEYITTFSLHIATKDKQINTLVETIDEMRKENAEIKSLVTSFMENSGDLKEILVKHINDESNALGEMHTLIKEMSPFQNKLKEEEIYNRLKKEKEQEEVSTIERKKTKYGVFFWIVSGILSVIGLFEVIRHWFEK